VSATKKQAPRSIEELLNDIGSAEWIKGWRFSLSVERAPGGMPPNMYCWVAALRTVNEEEVSARAGSPLDAVARLAERIGRGEP
jgi:hypothetical protein